MNGRAVEPAVIADCESRVRLLAVGRPASSGVVPSLNGGSMIGPHDTR